MSTKPQKELFTIGELAKKSGLKVSTLRFYERKGLLPLARRNAANYRLFSGDALSQILFVRRAQSLGFSLAEIRELLGWRQAERDCCAQVRAHAEKTAMEMREKISFLSEMHNSLLSLIRQCPGQGRSTSCPILGAMETSPLP